MKKIIIFMMIVIFASLATAETKQLAQSCPSISQTDRTYLQTIMKETWNYLDNHLVDKTGFPSDSQTGSGNTNTTNIGLYLASVGPAYKLGYLPREDAVQRIRKIIASVNRLEGKRGFFPNWIDVGGKTAITEPVLAVSDFNKLITGLILARQFFPEVYDEATPIIDRVEWARLYDSKTGDTHWGYDLKKDSPVGPGRFDLASDCRLVVFYMVASGSVPPEVWSQTRKEMIQADGLEFLRPGYHFGGLFMQAIGAIFLDDLTTEIGCSIADLAWHQIRESQRMGLKVWGWSNCNVPGKGYTEGGFLPWWVVTPHASALVIEFYPRHVIANLRQLESMELRKPLIYDIPYGFRDSVDLKTGLLDDRYLCLDQAMLFLSLVNYTEDQMVRKFFAADPLVKTGLKKLEKYRKQKPELLKKWAQRDSLEPQQVAAPPQKQKEVVFDFTQKNDFSILTQTWGGAKVETKQTADGLVVNFDLSAEEKSEAELKLQFPPIDSRTLNKIEITCSAVSKDEFGGIRVYLSDDQGLSQYSYIDGISPDTKTFTINEADRFGILARPQAVNSLAIKLWEKPWYFNSQETKASSGQLIIQKICLK